MEINDIGSIPGIRTYADPIEEESNTELGQEDFLKLMTEQLANQDPLEPQDNNEFMSQIAQFGAVEGINGLLDSFNDLATNLQSSQALEASNIIGRQVLVEHDQGYLPTTGTLDGAVELDSSSSNVAVNVYDSNGELFGRVDLGPQPAGLVQFNWDGTTFSGQRAPAGRYRIDVEATFGNTTESLTPQVADQVQSLTLGGVGQEMLVELENLGMVGFSQVNQIQ
ncbi:MAG: flagellar hook assembly protein FlgD [Gammaproteobacteria bacterium]|nr:flagellar hook assembly protein FlgD [Gammaproteobacteria bacterium]